MANKARTINLKNMKEALVNFSADQKEMNKIWNGFYTMAVLGFIAPETWRKFSDECHGWYIWQEGSRICVRDRGSDDGIIWEYTPDAEYRA